MGYNPEKISDEKAKMEAPTASFRSAGRKMLARPDLRPETTPAPGAYNPRKISRSQDSLKRRGGAQRPSSMFSNFGLDRFGRPYVPKTLIGSVPGPGSYHNAIPPVEIEPAKSVWALSNTGRAVGASRPRKTRMVKPPGPAFYKPNMKPRKSFHLNVERK